MKKTGLCGLAIVLGAVLLPTITFAQSYYPYDYYQYSNNRDRDVECIPEQQTIGEGQTAYFIAYGGDGDYDWTADGRTYRDRGTRFAHEFDDKGTERVTVRSDGETATCRVRIVDRSDYYSPYSIYPASPIYTQPVNITTTYVPQAMPNTGFPPVSSAAFAFAVVLLLGAGLVLTPYAKKLTATWR